MRSLPFVPVPMDFMAKSFQPDDLNQRIDGVAGKVKPLDDLSASAAMLSAWLDGRKPQLAIVLGSGIDGLLPHLSGDKIVCLLRIP